MMMENTKAFVPNVKLSTGDVFVYQDEGLLLLDDCFLIEDIDNVELVDGEFIANVYARNICNYQELFLISKDEFINGYVGGEPEYHEIDLARISVIGHISSDTMDSVPNNDNDSMDSSSVTFVDDLKLDFGDFDSTKEDNIMRDSLIGVIVDCPSVAAEFVRYYQEQDNVDAIANRYDIEPNQVEDVIERIKKRYAVSKYSSIKW